jgi:hypothetical protein
LRSLGLDERRNEGTGVEGVLHNDEYVPTSASSDGVETIDSLDTDLDVIVMLCLSASSSPSNSISSLSDGSNKKSKGEPAPKDDAALVSLFHSCLKCSMDTRRGRVEALALAVRLFRGGIAVTDSSAATAGGMELGS